MVVIRGDFDRIVGQLNREIEEGEFENTPLREARALLYVLNKQVEALNREIEAHRNKSAAFVEWAKANVQPNFAIGDKVVDTSKDELVVGEVVNVYFEKHPSTAGWRYVVAPLSNLVHSKHYSDKMGVLKKIKMEAK